ncbi:MAG: hypothetical protein ACE5RO_03505, partial [Candidatus Nitrosomaritimum yanchengensis]
PKYLNPILSESRRILENAMVPKMTPMATDEYLGIVYGLVNDKQLHDSNSVMHHCMRYLTHYYI